MNNGNGIKNTIITFLLGTLLSGLVFFFKDWMQTKDFITRVEAQDMVNSAPFPYVTDRKYILESLNKLQKDVDFIKDNFWKTKSNGIR